MIINIRGDKLVVTKAIKEYIEEKLNHLNKYFENPDAIECKVVIKVKNNMQMIEVTIPISKLIIRAEEKDKDLYTAIDLVLDKLESQIRKNKSFHYCIFKFNFRHTFIFILFYFFVNYFV